MKNKNKNISFTCNCEEFTSKIINRKIHETVPSVSPGDICKTSIYERTFNKVWQMTLKHLYRCVHSIWFDHFGRVHIKTIWSILSIILNIREIRAELTPNPLQRLYLTQLLTLTKATSSRWSKADKLKSAQLWRNSPALLDSVSHPVSAADCSTRNIQPESCTDTANC